jgi:hypothetical protein
LLEIFAEYLKPTKEKQNMKSVMHARIMIEQKELPFQFLEYVNSKTRKNEDGGRPHFLMRLAKNKDPKEELLNILELAWLRNKNLRIIARDYNATYQTIYRIFRDLKPLKGQLAQYLTTVPRRKRWYVPELDSSDYETIQIYINRAKRDGLKNYKRNILLSQKAWTYFNYRDPAYWSADDVCGFLASLSSGSQSGMLDCLRQVAPQLKDQVKTGRFREKLSRHKKDVFGKEVKMIHQALESEDDFQGIKTLFDLHITLGAREGSRDPRSGLVGLTWDKFKNGFTRVDLFESKVRGGICWRDCPLDLFFRDLPERLKQIWIHRGRPTSEKLLRNGYKELTRTYKTIRNILRIYYEGNVDPSLLKEFITLRPHDADKIHVNLLWEAEIPLEVVAGQFIGQGEGIGLMGRGWLDINVIKKYYLSLTQRSERFRKLENQVHMYSNRFNGSNWNLTLFPCLQIPSSESF